MSADTTPKELAIRSIVNGCVMSFAEGFQLRHESEINKPDGTINMKIHNVFIEALGPEIQYYSALARSLDSSLGNMLEKLAMQIAELSFEVHSEISGTISEAQISTIAHILEGYKSRRSKPTIDDYKLLRESVDTGIVKQHSSDYYLIDRTTERHVLIELKIGGDLDNKKARSEKEAIMEQYTILTNSLPAGSEVYTYFATAYNRFGEDKSWQQERVRQFFAEEELLIGKDFWNFGVPVGVWLRIGPRRIPGQRSSYPHRAGLHPGNLSRRMTMYETVLADSIEHIKTIDEQSVNLILTDPPYNLSPYSTGNMKFDWRSDLNNDLAEWDLEPLLTSQMAARVQARAKADWQHLRVHQLQPAGPMARVVRSRV